MWKANSKGNQNLFHRENNFKVKTTKFKSKEKQTSKENKPKHLSIKNKLFKLITLTQPLKCMRFFFIKHKHN